jgi:hypothetical protein
MPAVSFVQVPNFATPSGSANMFVTLPSSILAGDGLIAVINTDGPIDTVPFGWTLKGSQMASGSGGTQFYIYVYEKDEVTADDSGTTVMWHRTATNWWDAIVWQLRGTPTAPPSVAEVAFNHLDNTSYTISNAAVTATTAGEFFIVSIGSRAYSGSDLPVSQPTWALGYIKSDNSSTNNGRHVWAGYPTSSSGESMPVGSWVMQPGSTTINAMVAASIRVQGVINGRLTEDLAIDSIALKDGQFVLSTADALGMGEKPIMGTPVGVADIFSAVDRLLTSNRFGRTVIDNAAIAEAFDVVLGKVIREAIQLAEAVWPNLHFGATITDTTLKIASRLAVAYPMAASDTLSFEDALKCVAAAQVIEKLRLAEVVNSKATYNLTLTQTVRLSDTLRRFFGGEAIDGFEFTDAMVAKPILGASATDEIDVADAMAPHFILRVIAEDGVGVVGEWLPQMIYDGKMLDGLEISAGFVEPNGSITTWAINAKSGAATTYDNYAFNSFGQMGLKYIGASESGLYELNGDSDDGAAVIARLKSGFMSFGQMHLSSIKGVYLGIRGGGDFFLKIEDGTGKTTTYKAVTRDFETTRLNTGKGLRARFFRFELTSTGQDFDIEAIEFIPLVAVRRRG